jgi:hypothetical protein
MAKRRCEISRLRVLGARSYVVATGSGVLRLGHFAMAGGMPGNFFILVSPR